MTNMKCKFCGNCYHWKNAFSKFGYNDGDGHIGTAFIAQILEDAGYEVEYATWRPHNTLIHSIKKHGIEFMPRNTSKYLIGYDDPEKYLPADIVDLLNDQFPQPRIFH